MGVTTYLLSKIASACGGLAGGLTFMAFLKPKSIMDATIRGGVSTASAIIGAGVFLDYFQLADTIEFHLFAGGVIGFLSWGVLGLIARVFIKAEQKQQDAIDVIKTVTQPVEETPAPTKPVRKPRSKRTPK
jgi:hypothetical protein